MKGEAYVTIAADEVRAHGCLVLGHSLRQRCDGRRQLVALVGDDVSWSTSQLLQQVYDVVERVPKVGSELSGIAPTDEVQAAMAKIRCWRLTNYQKCVFLSADTLVLQNCDELFERSEFSAAPNVSWPDWFDSNVFVFEPKLYTYWQLVNCLREKERLEGGDEQLLNDYFHERWRADLQTRLPFIYNLVCTKVYTYTPAFHQFCNKVKIVQFAGLPKPWTVYWDRQSGRVKSAAYLDASFQPFFQEWMDIFSEKVLHHVPTHQKPTNVGSADIVRVADIIPVETWKRPDAVPSQHKDDSHVSPLFFPSVPSVPSDTLDRTSAPIWQSEAPSSAGAAKSPVQHHAATPVQESQATEAKSTSSQSSAPSVTCEVKSPSPTTRETSNIVHHPVQETTTASAHHHHAGCKSISTPAIPSNESLTPRLLYGEKFQSPSVTEIVDLPTTSVPDTPTGQQHPADDDAKSSSVVDDDDDDDNDFRLKCWQQGDIDYMGQDSFDNIWKRLSALINKAETTTEIGQDGTATSESSSWLDTASSDVEPSDQASSQVQVEESKSTVANDDDDDDSGIPGYSVGDYDAMHDWEEGNIDYDGRDSSDNIMKRLDYFIRNCNQLYLEVQ